MTHGEMVNRIVAFKRGEGEGRCLRDCDPACADALNHWWECFGPHGKKPCKVCVDNLFNEVERRLAEHEPDETGGTK